MNPTRAEARAASDTLPIWKRAAILRAAILAEERIDLPRSGSVTDEQGLYQAPALPRHQRLGIPHRQGYIICMTLTLPPELEQALSEQARARNTTPEMLALDSLQERFAPPAASPDAAAESLYDFLQGYAGTIDGTTDALSENTGQRFADGMAEKHRSGKL